MILLLQSPYMIASLVCFLLVKIYVLITFLIFLNDDTKIFMRWNKSYMSVVNYDRLFTILVLSHIEYNFFGFWSH